MIICTRLLLFVLGCPETKSDPNRICVLMDFRYGAVSRSVTVFALKTRFIITSAAILTYFVNANLKFSAILHGKLNSTLKIFSKGRVIVYSLVCPVFDRLDFIPDKICVYVIITARPLPFKGDPKKTK